MKKNSLQILVSSVNKDAEKLIQEMNIQTDAIIVNQVQKKDGEFEFSSNIEDERNYFYSGFSIKVFNRKEKGVGLSRNTALEASDHDLIQFADDDIVYDRGYPELVVKEFENHPEADILLFNVKAQEGRETYWNNNYSKVSWYNYGRYPAYAICAKREKIEAAGIRYSLLFGGGAPHMNGEDSLFLHDCLEKGLKIYRTSVQIGHEKAGESTWFIGYTDKFFYDRGVLYHFLYGKMAKVWGLRFLIKNRNTMCAEKGLVSCFKLLSDGIKYGRTLKKI